MVSSFSLAFPRSDHMADSKAYVSFVLLFALLLSSHVLTHELPEVGTRAEEEQYTPLAAGYKPRDFQWPPGHWSPPPRPPRQDKTKKNHYSHSVGYHNSIGLQSTFSSPDELASKGGTRAEVDQYTPMAGSKPRDFQWPPGHWTPPRQHKTKKDHYTHSIGYHNSMGLQSTFSPPGEPASKETRNHEDGTVMRDRKMMRPSETDWKSFHDFSAKSSRMTDGDKTGYNGASNMEEEVGEETVK